MPTQVDIVEGTFQMFKIETRKLLSPLKLYITYKDREITQSDLEQSNEPKKLNKDLRILYSQTIPKPEEYNCDGVADGVLCLTIEASDERVFNRDYVYLKLSTVDGCQASLKLAFPKQDVFDNKQNKAFESQDEEAKDA